MGCVIVAYRDAIRLRLPIPATDLSSSTFPAPRTKWTLAAIPRPGRGGILDVPPAKPETLRVLRRLQQGLLNTVRF